MIGRAGRRKILRDASTFAGRALALLVALSVGVFTVSSMLGAYSIVSREVSANYVRTNPASATIEVDAVTPAVLAAVRRFPGVAEVEARAVIEARAKVGDDWMRMLLFVVDDFSAIRLNRFDRLSGDRPPPRGSMLIEREAAGVLRTQEGGSVTVRTPRGAPAALHVAGTVHDTTLAPAWQEQSGYGYITRETLARLGEPPVLDELRILFEGAPTDVSVVDAKAVQLAQALRSRGVSVHAVKVPPPGRHPHYGQMLASLRSFLVFSSLALLLSAILVAAVLAAILARQVREIGIMKAIGASGGQIGLMYGTMLLGLGALSLVIGLPLGLVVAGRLSLRMAEAMNFTVSSTAIAPWVYATLIAAGALLPLLVSLPTIARASRVSVREALGSNGQATSFAGGAGSARALTFFSGGSLPLRLALRNMFRRRGRLALSLALLSVGGALFMASINARDGWREMADRVNTDRFYDGQLLLAEAVPEARINSVLAPVAGLRGIEIWSSVQTAFAQEGRIDVQRLYPDRGHGSFMLRGVPPETGMVRFPVKEGRWLVPGDLDAVVLTPAMMAQIPEARVGDAILLSVAGRATRWRIVGVVVEVGGGGAYVSREGYTRAGGVIGAGNDVLLSVSADTPDDRDRIIRAAERALDDAGLGVERSMPLDRLHAAMKGHVEVPVRMLIAASALLAVIGALGLASMMTINVLERTRELGVMRAVGASTRLIVSAVIGESGLIAAASWVLALLLSLPLTFAVGRLGAAMFGTPLPFMLSVPALSVWLAAVIVIAVAASAAPALQAARLVVREALAYE